MGTIAVGLKDSPSFLVNVDHCFVVSLKLLQFALRASSTSASVKELTEEGALFQAIRRLVTNSDCLFLAVLAGLVQFIFGGRIVPSVVSFGPRKPV